jgi:hypothetical protein
VDALLHDISTDIDNILSDFFRVQVLNLEDIKKQIPMLVNKVKERIGQIQAIIKPARPY